ncbi:hypothetical protein B5M44_24010 [Shinella sumterensis]|uniref:hypothetical protein n=1 Tax=Shinella sumterensis TaxID=1967501 RepID=UPI00106EA4D3|nr:hypothetical protein [Shinella sumterensis]MCD1264536.1 hypothetical protein [Shinella sumterensis]TFE94087.1 hypothetical protein B5M44_24010 [Shinella sumterensis]
MSKQVTIENALAGGIGLPTGQVVPGHGSIAVEPEIWDESKEHPVVAALVKDGSLIIDGKGKKKSALGERDENGDTEEMAEMRKRFDASYSALQSELQAEKAKVADLEKLIADRGASGQPAALKAEHHGGGKFNVTQGETMLLSGLSKADADAFNAMSDEDKAAYVEASKK